MIYGLVRVEVLAHLGLPRTAWEARRIEEITEKAQLSDWRQLAQGVG